MDALSVTPRRRFLQISAATMAAASATAGVAKLAGRAPGVDVPAQGLQQIPTFCDICFWKCARLRTSKTGRLEARRQPGRPAEPGRLCPRGTGGVGAHFR